MHEIIELTDALSNKIAAGEVVERPASVVKELTENAIDAKSTIIEIDVEEAGLGKIRVIDNGDGIRKEDAILAFKRHATSKIKDENDLFRIRTLGFRGEALPSIASVSFLELTTAQDGEVGAKIILEGGILKSQENAPSRKGTDIIVSNLFYNTPARLKYLKTIHTEIGHISDIINRLALAHPNISFRLRHNERILLHTNGNGDVRQVLAAIYGINIARKMIPIQSQTLDYTIEGYIALPEITRASRNYLSTMINGRFVRNYPLVKAILDGYHTLLPIGRFPIVLLSIQMDPILVDVNVHPTKMEVRLSKESELYNQVTSMIKQAFAKQTLIPKHVESTRQQLKRSEQSTLLFESNRQAVKKTTFNKHADKEKLLPPEEMKKLYEPAEQKIDTGFLTNEPPIQVTQEEKHDAPETNEGEIKEDGDRVPPLYPIGQMHGTYIFAQNDRGLYMIDQHAAQERIKYEYYREKVGQVSNELQDLLVPMTLEFTPDDYVKIAEYKQELEQIGLFLEDFGMNSFIIRAHPSWFPNGREKETIEDIIEQLLSMKKIDIKKLLEEAAIMMSCKASIKANQYLRNDEIEALLDDLRNTENPFTCPHGRPVIVHMTTYEMEKMFKR